MSLAENIPPLYRELLQRPVAVFGCGASGKAVANLLAHLEVPAVCYDQRAGDEAAVSRTFDAQCAARHRLVIHSPAFRMNHPWIEVALGQGCCVVSEIDFAQQLRRGPTIVITGTDSKTLLQEFITFSLKRAGISAVAAGQNQHPLSRLAVHPELDGVTAVCELGPAFLRPLREFRFGALFWTNFREDHLEDPEQLRAAFDVFRRLINLSPEARFHVGDSVVRAAEQLGRPLPKSVRAVRPEDYPDWDLPARSAFAMPVNRPLLALFRRYWLESGCSDSLLKSAAEQFEARAYQLHRVADVGGTGFWSDAHAANLGAAEEAIASFPGRVVWIGGGHFRGGDMKAFVGRVGGRLHGAVITGSAVWHMLPALEEAGIPCRGALNLRQAAETALEMSAGTVPVLFSPGFITGEEYGDFMERGICFENAVFGLKPQKGSV